MNSQKLLNYLIWAFSVGVLSAVLHALNFNNFLPLHIVFSDIASFYERVAGPGWPYFSKLMEYPVLTGLFIQFMTMIGKTGIGYYIASSVFLIGAMVASTYFLNDFLEKDRKNQLLTYWIFAPSMLFFLVYNWDIFAVFCSILAFYFFQKNKHFLSAIFLALGFSFKFYPAIYLIPLLIKQPNSKNALKIVLIFLAIVGIINIPFMIANFSGWFFFFKLNSARLPNFDSIWTAIRYFLPYLHNNAQRINVISSALLASFYFYSVWKFRKESFLKLCFIVTLGFLIFNKVFSPQYILWLLPFFVLFQPPKLYWFYLLEFSNLIVLFIALRWFFIEQSFSYMFWSMPFIFLRHLILIYLLSNIWNKKTA